MLTIFGCHGRASMSATEWIGASQVTRSRDGSRIGLGLVVDVGVLEPGVGEGLDQLRVELRVGVDVDRRALVLALQVERVDGAGLDELRDQLVVQSLVGSSLKRRSG